MIRSVQPARSLIGMVTLPGDKSISHRYAMLAAIAEGTSQLGRFASSRDCRSTLECLRRLGVEVREAGESVAITGRGLRGLKPPATELDAGNSGTTMRLLSGILAGHPFESVMVGDESLSRRPMDRIIRPLRLMGADVEPGEGGRPPLRIRGGGLKALRYTLPVPSAQVKSCLLLAGLYGDGATAVEESIPTRDHTEIALRHFGGTIRVSGTWIEVEPDPQLQARRLEVPGDLSSAAFFLTAAAMLPGSDLLLLHAGLNRRRRELLEYLRAAGLDIAVEEESEDAGEARGNVRVRQRTAMHGVRLLPIQGSQTANLIDEIPVLSVLGSQLDSGLTISDARELRVKESDRIAAVAANLRAMGAVVEEKPDGLSIPGPQRLHGAEIDTRGDHRIAMAFAVAGLVADGETRIHQAECADVSYPGFWEALEDVVSR
jgi:3-phosphoshikimate 1-carboxyvinyltransferase